jgi:hypothetical protein
VLCGTSHSQLRHRVLSSVLHSRDRFMGSKLLGRGPPWLRRFWGRTVYPLSTWRVPPLSGSVARWLALPAARLVLGPLSRDGFPKRPHRPTRPRPRLDLGCPPIRIFVLPFARWLGFLEHWASFWRHSFLSRGVWIGNPRRRVTCSSSVAPARLRTPPSCGPQTPSGWVPVLWIRPPCYAGSMSRMWTGSSPGPAERGISQEVCGVPSPSFGYNPPGLSR